MGSAHNKNRQRNLNASRGWGVPSDQKSGRSRAEWGGVDHEAKNNICMNMLKASVKTITDNLLGYGEDKLQSATRFGGGKLGRPGRQSYCVRNFASDTCKRS